MDPKKVRRLRKLVEALVRKELKEMEDTGTGKKQVDTFFGKLENSPVKTFLSKIDNDMEKKFALAKFAKLIGFDPKKLSALKTAMKP